MNHKGKKAGIYYNLPENEYRADPAIACSDIKKILKSPLEYWTYSWMNPNKPVQAKTPAMILGSALHKFILEKEDFYKEYIVLPNKLELDSEFYEKESEKPDFDTSFALPSSKNAKTFKYIGDRKIIKQSDFTLINEMSGYLGQLPVVNKVFTGGNAEVSLFWQDEETGLMCKCRPDYLTKNYIADYKSINLVDNINYSIADGDYHIQKAFYLHGLQMVTNCDHNNFIFIFQQKEAPYLVRNKSLNEELLEFGGQLFRHGLSIAKEHFDKYGADMWIDDPVNYASSEYLGFEDLPARLQYKYKF